MCPDCDIYFTSKEHMKLHKYSALHEAKVGAVEKLHCTYCDKTFSLTKKFKAHERIHTFSQLWYLKVHQEKHTNSD